LKGGPSEIKKKVKEVLSRIGEVKKVELEGPFVVVYVDDPSSFLESNNTVGEAAKLLRKKIIVMSSGKMLPEEDAKRIIREMIPQKAEITDIRAVEETREIYIIAKRTGYVVGKSGYYINEILKKTGWRPVVLRAPTMESGLLNTIYNYLIEGSAERKKIMRKIAERIYREPIGIERGIFVSFLGGAREVGRSSIAVTTNEGSVLLDAGISLGRGEAFPRYDLIDLDEIDAVIISHAHLDHSGALPFLFKYGYRGPVYVTRPTRDLIVLLLLDYINLSRRQGIIPYFSEADVARMLNHMIVLDYEETVDISPDVKLTFYNAGHILGSALVHLNIRKHNILYTGDFRFRETKLLGKADTSFPRVETLIMECTYGGEQDVLPPLWEAEKQLIQIIKDTIERNGRVLIPALSVGRAQEIMITLVEAFSRKEIPDVPVYIDGMVYDSTAIHSAYPSYLSDYIKARVFGEDKDPFTDEHFTMLKGTEDKDSIATGGPSIIIAPSGMLNGGPSVDYFIRMSPDPRNSVVLVSYQAEGTLGRELKEGAREIRIRDEMGEMRKIEVKAEIHFIEGFSAHADKVQLLTYPSSIPKPSRIILVHGEAEKIRSFKPLLSRSIGAAVMAPSIGEKLRLV
jgi:KH/beta-lactamase-domain protein